MKCTNFEALSMNNTLQFINLSILLSCINILPFMFYRKTLYLSTLDIYSIFAYSLNSIMFIKQEKRSRQTYTRHEHILILICHCNISCRKNARFFFKIFKMHHLTLKLSLLVDSTVDSNGGVSQGRSLVNENRIVPIAPT